jgi:hypothetical protein
MSNEYEDDNTLASLPTFKSNPDVNKRAEPKEALPVPAALWDSFGMSEVREAIEARASELGVTRHAFVTSDDMTQDRVLQDQFFNALAAYHGLPERMSDQPLGIAGAHLESKPGALEAALDGLKALDAAEPVTPAEDVTHDDAPQPEPSSDAQAEPTPSAQAGPAAAAAATPSGEPVVAVPLGQLESLLRAATAVQAKKLGTDPEVSPENIAEAVEAIRQGKPVPGMTIPAVTKGSNVGDAAAQVTQGVVGAGASLLGGMVKGTAAAVRKGFEAMRTDKDDAPTPEVRARPRPMVLPHLSQYRVAQVEDQANRYSAAHDAFWDTGKMPEVRKAIEDKARETGLSVEDVMHKMKPGGEMHELHERFIDAYNDSPGAADHRKVMNKAIEGFVRQYGQAQEEMLAPEQQGGEDFEGYKDRVNGARDSIFKKAGHVPLLDGEDKTHLQKLQDAVAKVIEKVKEMVNGFTNMLRGKGGAEKEAGSEPAP